MNLDQVLDQARQAVEKGDRETGKRLLVSLLHANPRHVPAWLLLSDIVDSDQQREDCLHRVLALDPGHPLALEKLGTRPLAHPRSGSAAPRGTAAPSSLSMEEIAERTGILEQPVEREIPPSQPSGYLADEHLRRRGYRYVMLAGALVFTLLLGLVLLLLIVSTIIPQAQEKRRPAIEPVLYTATLWCLPCEQAGTPIILWEQAGDGISRGAKVGELPHGTLVSVLAEKWSEAEGRMYYRVSADGQQGWVPDSFFK